MKTRLFFLAALLLSLSGFEMKSQCSASFTYTLGTNGQLSLTSTSTGVNAGTKYNWWVGNGNYLPNVGPTVTYTYPYNGTYSVKLFIQDSTFMGSCSDSIRMNITISNAANTACLPATFTYTVTGGQVSCTLTNPTTYNFWTFGDGGTASNTSTPTHNYTSNGTFPVVCYTQYLYSGNVYLTCDTVGQYVSVTSVPCLAQFWADSNTVNNSIVLHNTAQGADTLYYSVNGGPYTMAYTYQNDTLFGLPAGNNTVCQKIIGAGCTDTICKTVFVNCTMNVANTVACGQTTFSCTSNQTITSASWSIGGSVVSTQVNPVITFTNTSNFYISYNLQTSLCQKTDSVMIQVGPSANFWLAPDTTLGLHNWKVYVNNQPNYTSYFWSWGDGTTSNTAFPTHNYANPGWYNICLTVHDNCGDSATSCQNDTVYRSSGVNSMVYMTVVPQNVVSGIATNNSGKIKIYPVPAIDFIMLENLQGATRVDLFDNEGRKVLSEQLNSSQNKSQLNIESIAKGFYILKIYAGNDVWQKKIIKQ